MKRKILTMLLALCLIVGLLPVTTLAASGAATLSYAAYGDFHVTPVSVTVKEGETKYFLTELGSDPDWPLVSFMNPDGASADSYHVKLDYPTGGVPTLYLKDAVITSDYGLTLATANGATLVVESDSTIGKTNSDAYRDHCINFQTTGDVTITGAGKLTIHGSGRANYSDGYILTNGNLLIKDANIALIDAPKYGDTQAFYGGTAILAEGGDITIDHSSIYADYNYKKVVTNLIKATDVDGKGGNITVKNLSNIEIWSAGHATGGCNAFNIPKDEDLTDSKTWLIAIENSNVEVGMCYHAAGSYSVFSVTSDQIVLKDTDEVIAMLPDASAGELWCEDYRTYLAEYEDEEDPVYGPLTVIYVVDEYNEAVKTFVPATLENGALSEYDEIPANKVNTLKYFKLTHVCIAEDNGTICSSCGAEITNEPEATTPEEDDPTFEGDDLPTIPQATNPTDDNAQKEYNNVILYVVLAVVAVAIIAAAVVVIVMKKKNNDKEEDETEENA